MNGVHDIGGMHGMGPIQYESNEPVFHELRSERWRMDFAGQEAGFECLWRNYLAGAGARSGCDPDLGLRPLFNYFLYPAINRFFPLTPIRKMGTGFFLTGASFVVIWWLQTRIEAGDRPTVWWQFFAYLFLIAGEVMVSVTGLEFSYTQAPQKMKSIIMGGWLLTIWAGDQFVATLNLNVIPWLRQFHINLEGSSYYLFFTILMLVTAILFIFFSRFYRGKTYIQDEEPVVE
jgi:proton-dependent oligopeptide transporter, POT family